MDGGEFCMWQSIGWKDWNFIAYQTRQGTADRTITWKQVNGFIQPPTRLYTPWFC